MSATGDGDLTRILAVWAERDGSRAIHPHDVAAIRATEAARSLVIELFVLPADGRDLFNACARLGALLAEAGASPSLAAGTIGGAASSLADAGMPFADSRIAPATAALLESYVAAVRESERAVTRLSWEYPACVVPLPGGAVAIACGHPTGDGEALTAWASRIAGRLVKEKVREAVLSGESAAKAEVASALELVGVTVRDLAQPSATSATSAASAATKPPDTARPTKTPKSWLRLPWRK